jgi:hypothetical protein
VDDSFARARAYVAEHFADVPAERFHCSSWLLDPYLPQALPGTNLASFQERWTLHGEGRADDEEVVFFVFRRRGRDLTGLPRGTALERVVLDRLESGGHWRVPEGTIPLGR